MTKEKRDFYTSTDEYQTAYRRSKYPPLTSLRHHVSHQRELDNLLVPKYSLQDLRYVRKRLPFDIAQTGNVHWASGGDCDVYAPRAPRSLWNLFEFTLNYISNADDFRDDCVDFVLIVLIEIDACQRGGDVARNMGVLRRFSARISLRRRGNSQTGTF